jgi:hypothetical protein
MPRSVLCNNALCLHDFACMHTYKVAKHNMSQQQWLSLLSGIAENELSQLKLNDPEQKLFTHLVITGHYRISLTYIPDMIDEHKGVTTLMVAAACGNMKYVRAITERAQLELINHKQTHNNRTALSEAIIWQRSRVVQHLLSIKGIDLTQKTDYSEMIPALCNMNCIELALYFNDTSAIAMCISNMVISKAAEEINT